MNRVILKQQKKSEEKKEKKKQMQEPIRITKSIIKQKLIEHFKHHIGEENKTTSEEIFQIVIGVNSAMVNSFARFYFWKQIENAMRELRSKDRAFIIRKLGTYFILKEQEEADYYKRICDKAVERMENAKDRADKWVENEKWRDFKKGNYDDKIENKNIKPKEEKTQKEKIEENINNTEKKIIKLWKGEKGE